MSGDVVISFTTLPCRIAQLDKMLLNLVEIANATPEIKQIVAAIPHFSDREQVKYEVPEWWHTIPKLRVLRCADHGPATKYIPVINDLKARGEDETHIFVVDDDVMHPLDVVTALLRGKREVERLTGRRCAVTTRGRSVHPSLNWRSCPLVFSRKLRKPLRVDLLTGVGGFLIQPTMFRAAQLEHPPLRALFLMDDVWISGNLALNHVPVFTLPGIKQFKDTQFKGFTLNLTHDVGNQSLNKQALQHFDAVWPVKLTKNASDQLPSGKLPLGIPITAIICVATLLAMTTLVLVNITKR